MPGLGRLTEACASLEGVSLASSQDIDRSFWFHLVFLVKSISVCIVFESVITLSVALIYKQTYKSIFAMHGLVSNTYVHDEGTWIYQLNSLSSPNLPRKKDFFVLRLCPNELYTLQCPEEPFF